MGYRFQIVAVLLALLFITMSSGQNVWAQTYAVTIRVDGFPSTLTTRVFVDGIFNTTLRGGESKSYSFSALFTGTHSISVDGYVPSQAGLNGTRYFNGNNSWTFIGSGQRVFSYRAQYLLRVVSDYGTTSGGGWYNEGERAVAKISAKEISGGPGTRYAFSGWSGDATGTATTSNEIVMDRPKSAVAAWKTQYLLTITTNPAGITKPSGEGWYDAGTTVSFSAPQIASATSDRRYLFRSWSGDFQGTAIQGSVLMNSPKTVTAEYVRQFLLTIKFTPPDIASKVNVKAEGWYDEGSSVQLGPVPSEIRLKQNERLLFYGWIDNQSNRPGESLTVLMDSSRVVEVVYRTQYYVRVASTYGSTFGDGWYFSGDNARFGVAFTQNSYFVKYTLVGWRVDGRSQPQKVNDFTWVIVVDGPYELDAIWDANYSNLFGLLSGVGALGVVSVASVVLFMKRSGRRFGTRRKGKEYFGIPPTFTPPTTVACGNCGNSVPLTARFCDKCGSSPFAAPSTAKGSEIASDLDSRVYDYIVRHDGVISVSQATKDLGLTSRDILAGTERLKRAGKLS